MRRFYAWPKFKNKRKGIRAFERVYGINNKPANAKSLGVSKNLTLKLMDNVTWEHQQIHQELRVAGGRNALSGCTIYWQIEAFEDGDESIELVNDNPHMAVEC